MKPVHPGPKQVRWNRIFKSDGRALIVALDHIPSGLMQGWEFPEETLNQILEGKPDAIMANFGILKRFAHLLTEDVGTILRLDGGPSYLVEDWPNYSHWDAFYSVEDAINLGADAVIANVFIGGRSEIDSMRVAARMAADCLRLGLPCAFEPLPVEGAPTIKNYLDPEIIAFASRMAAEFGADFIKTYYTGNPETFRRVTARCPVPVLMAGGPKLDSDRHVLEAVHGMLQGGGCGIFIGRNAWQHRNPPVLLRALGQLLHQNMTLEDTQGQLDQIS